MDKNEGDHEKNIQTLTRSDVQSVYSGINGRCCCGCSGTYYYNPAYKERASEKQGYEVRDDERSIRMISKILGIIKTHFFKFTGNDIISVVVGSRLYVVYLVK